MCCGNVIYSRIIIGIASTSLLPISCGYRVPKLRALCRRTQEEDVLNRGSRVQIPHGAATVMRQQSCRPARTPARKRACVSGVSPRTRPRSRLYCVAKQPRRIVVGGKPSLSVFCGSASPIPRVCVQKRTREKERRRKTAKATTAQMPATLAQKAIALLVALVLCMGLTPAQPGQKKRGGKRADEYVLGCAYRRRHHRCRERRAR